MKPRRFLFQSARVFSIITLACSGLATQAGAAIYQWDPNGSATGLGGAGIWDDTNLLWDAVGTAPDDGTGVTEAVVFTSLDKAIFGGTAGAVSLGANVTLNAIQFDTVGYSISGGTLTLAGTSPTITTTQGATIASTLDGSSGLTKAGSGTLTLTAANLYKGTTTVSAGTLQLDNTLNGGVSVSGLVNNGTVVIDNNTAQTFSGAVSGSGAFTVKSGSSLTFTGGTVSGGAARSFSGGNTTGSAAGGTVNWSNEALTPDQYVSLTGGVTVNVQNGASITGNNNFHLGYTAGLLTYTGMNTVNMTGGSLTMPSTVSVGWHESGTLNQSGGTITVGSTAGGFLIRRGATATGTYNLSGGLLSSTTSGIDLGNAAAGTWNFTGGTALVNKVVVSSGTPTWNFTGGTLKASAAFTIPSTIPINLTGTNGNAVVDTNSFALGISGVMSGVGGITKMGSGTLSLSGVNTYTGVTNVTGGTVLLDYTAYAAASGNPANYLSSSSSLQLGGGVFSVKGLGNNAAVNATAWSGGVALGSGLYSLTFATLPAVVVGQPITATGLTGAYVVSIDSTNKKVVVASSSTPAATGTDFAATATTSTTTTQTLASATLTPGASTINTVLNGGTSNTINLGPITRNAGSTLNITAATALSSTASTTEKVITTGLTYNGASIALPGSGTKYVGAGIFANTGATTRYAQVNASGQFLQGPTATGWISTGGDSATVYNASNAGVATAGAALTGATTTYATIFNWGTATTQALGSFNLTTNGILNIGTATTTISGAGNVVIGAEKDLVINTATTGGVTISSGIQDSAGGASSLTFTGQSSGVLSLNTTNKTYTGGTYVNSGTLSLDGGGGSSGIIRGTVNVATGATLRLNSADVTGYSGGTDCIRTINLNGGTLNVNTGSANQTLGNTAINMTGASITGATGSKMDFFQGSSAINSLASSVASTITTTALKIRQSGGLTINVADGAAASDLQIDSVIGNDASFTSAPLIKSGAGVLLLNATNNYTGATTINAGTLQIGSAGSLGSGTYSANITNNGTLFQYSSSANQTLSGVISGSGSLSKDTGAGTLTLSGNNTYTGTTTVSAGRLNITSATNASSIVLKSGGVLASSGSTTGSLTAMGGTIALNGVNPNSSLTVGGSVNFVASTALSFDAKPTSTGAISQTIVAYGTTATGVNNITLPSGFRSGAIIDDTVNKKVLFGFTTGSRIWNNDSLTAGNWNNLTDATWLNGDGMFASGDEVTFDDEATNGSVNLVGTLLPGLITFNNSDSGTTYVLSGSGLIGGLTSVVKNGTGTVTFQNANTYTGGTTVNAGTLILNSTTAPWNGGIIHGAVTVNNGGTLRIAAGNNTAPTDAININGGGLLDYSLAYDASGNGTTYIGSVNLSSANGTAATVSGIGAARMGFHANGLISSTGSVANTWSANLQTVNGSGYKVTFDVAASNTLNMTGNITQMTGYLGTPLVKNSPGTLVLSGNNSFTGGFTINDGVVRLASSTAFPNANALTMTGAGSLELNNNSVSLASLTSAATNTITNQATSAGTATLTINNAGTIANKFTDGANGTLALRVSNATGNFTMTGSANNFSGGIVLTGGGTRMSTGTTVLAGAYGSGPITVGEGATEKAQIYPGGTQTLSNPIISNTILGTDRPGTLRVDVTNLVLSGTLTANLAPMAFNTNSSGTMSVTGKITGPNGLMLIGNNTLGAANGSLIVTLNNASGTNDYAGDTTINQTPGNGVDYTLTLGSADQIPNGSGKGNVVINTSTTAVGTFNLAGYNETINGLSGNGTVDSSSGTPTLTLGDGDATASFSGVIKNVALTKTGTGIQTLTGANSYLGATTVNAGELAIDGDQSTATGDVLVTNSGSTLSGTGTVGGATTIASGAILSPGTSGVGTLNMANNLTMQSGSTYAVKVSSSTASNKVVLATGKTLVMNGTIAITATGHTFAVGDSYDVADASTITGTPTISPATPGAGLQWNTSAFASSGVISVEAVAGGYDSWKNVITDVAMQGREKDADGDGFSNLQEFLFGTSPISNDGSLTSSEVVAGNLVIHWKQRSAGATYTLKSSATLGNDWANATGATIETDGSAVGDYQPMKATITLGASKTFYRVEAVEN